ncbi:MAG: hypothetical protein FJ202_03115 [Gemmatimonadetes bacterium]|nr:hypothetical protein [Gemmatimonadota bacterium]
MKVLRSTFVAAVAVLAAACGDKVEIVQPAPASATPTVNSVSVSPATATMSIGQTVNFTAVVGVSNNAGTTVTWSSSDAAKVSVSTTGTATAVAATPGVAICATSTVDATKKGCASVAVTAAATVVPAQVSVASITVTGNTNTTVNPAAVAGNIDVRLNVNPGTQTPQRLVLIVGGVRQDSQVFTAAQAAALRAAADEAAETQATFPQILFSVNTAAYNTATGVPRWTNTNQSVSAQLYVSGSTSAAATATAQQNLTFANANGFHVTLSGGNTAVDAAGYRWNGNGSLTVTAVPVMYTATTLGTVSAALGANGACTALGTASSSSTATAGVYTITLALAGLQSAATCATTAPNMPVITATNSGGDNVTLATNGTVNTQVGVRWDNVTPVAVTGSTFAGAAAGNAVILRINTNPNGRGGGWINDGVVFNGSATSATSNNWLCNASAAGFNACAALDTLPRDAGVGGAVNVVGTGTTKALAYAAAQAGGATGAAAIAVSSTGATYCAVALSQDALGNRTTLTTAQQGTACAAEANSATFGVDRAPPTAAFSTSVAAGNMAANIAATALTQMRAIATDTGLTGNSGFVGGASIAGITGSISRRTATATSTTAVTVGAGAASNANINLTRVDGSGLGPVADTLVYNFAMTTTNAYYTLTTTMVDQAGNAGPALTRTVLRDATVPTALAPVQGIVNPTAGGSITYTSNVSDNLDLLNGSLTATFGAASFPVVLNVAGAVIANPSTATALTLVGPNAFNTYNTAPAVTTGTLTATIANLFALQSHQTDSITIGASANTYPTAINAVVNDMVTANTVTSAAGTVQNAPAVPAAYAIGTEYSKFLLARSGTTINVSGSTTVGAVFTRNITPRVEGTTAMAAPFSSVDIYVGINGAATAYTFVGTSTLTQQTDNGGQRIWTFSAVPYTITSGIAAAANQLVFIGLAKGAGGKWIAGQGITLTTSP